MSRTPAHGVPFISAGKLASINLRRSEVTPQTRIIIPDIQTHTKMQIEGFHDLRNIMDRIFIIRDKRRNIVSSAAETSMRQLPPSLSTERSVPKRPACRPASLNSKLFRVQLVSVVDRTETGWSVPSSTRLGRQRIIGEHLLDGMVLVAGSFFAWTMLISHIIQVLLFITHQLIFFFLINTFPPNFGWVTL